MDVANCASGRFRIAVDFNVTGTISKTTAFHVQILDLMGREIGFINVQAKSAGIQKARGWITLTDANQTILFRYEGGSAGNGNGKQSAVADVANSIEIQGVSLYAKRSQVGGLAASIRAALHNPRSRIVLFAAGAIALLTLAGYAMAGRRRDSMT